jgi:hypothetical protein
MRGGRVPRRTTDDNSGAELRAWLLAEQIEIYEAVTGPPRVPIDGRPPTQVDPTGWGEITDAMAAFWRPLAEGKAHRLCRRDLPPDHPARRVGDLSDYLVLTEANELVAEQSTAC